ncbi:MAG: hypothetical protein CL902_06105, partial [Dehalococcoidia bacterium]|nr:hypothetical protein [Dehalococcoidia bacterium]
IAASWLRRARKDARSKVGKLIFSSGRGGSSLAWSGSPRYRARVERAAAAVGMHNADRNDIGAHTRNGHRCNVFGSY